MPPTQPARQQRWRTSPRTSSVLPPTRSRRRVRRPPDANSAPAGSSAGGSANSSRMRSANSSLTISGCETTSAGRCSTASSSSSSGRDRLGVGALGGVVRDHLRPRRAEEGVGPQVPPMEGLDRAGLVQCGCGVGPSIRAAAGLRCAPCPRSACGRPLTASRRQSAPTRPRSLRATGLPEAIGVDRRFWRR
jgi:hypothetical protein